MTPSSAIAVPEPEFAAFVAIDWADQKNFWSLVPAGSQRREQGEFDQTPETVEEWVAKLQQRFGDRPIAVCLEQSRGALVYMLTKYPNLVLFPVHPTMAANYRKALHPSGAKSDPQDTDGLLDLLVRHRDKLRQLQPDTADTRLLHFLVEERRVMVDERTAQSNRLTDCLKLYFPQMLKWFDDVTTAVAGDQLVRWGTLEKLQRANPATLRKFYHEHNCRDEEKLDERIAAIYAAMPATKDEAVVEACMLKAQSLVAILRVLRSQIAGYDKRIKELVQVHPDAAVWDSFPGAGAALVPRLIAAFGTQRERFANAREMQCFSGIAPVEESSGKSEWTHFRFACPKFLRQTFHEYAALSIQQSDWARAYYDQQRNEKKRDHHKAVRALAFKWIRIMYRCWKDRKAYEERIHLESLRRRSSLATNIQWAQIGGFGKISKKTA
jgi:transposase